MYFVFNDSSTLNNGINDFLKRSAINFEKLKKNKYLIQYYIKQKLIWLKIDCFIISANFIFVVFLFKNTPICSYKYCEYSDMIAVVKTCIRIKFWVKKVRLKSELAFVVLMSILKKIKWLVVESLDVRIEHTWVQIQLSLSATGV